LPFASRFHLPPLHQFVGFIRPSFSFAVFLARSVFCVLSCLLGRDASRKTL
jgi:hypothetical protein